MGQDQGSLGRQLYRMTWPMLIGLLAIMSCQLVDSAFIGQLGAQPLVVVGFSIPVYQLIIGTQVGLGIATTTIISTALGAGQTDWAKQLGAMVIGTGLVLILALCSLLWVFQQQVVSTLGAQPELFPLLREYWFPWLISTWMGALLYFGYSIFRAHGETWLPGMVMVLTSVVNMVLDPILIFVLKMGIAGAAWATVIAFGIGCWIILSRILSRGLIVWPAGGGMIRDGLHRLLAFMAPAMMSQFMPPISAMLATSIVAFYGDFAIAAWGLGTRIELFSIILVLSLTMSMPPIIGRLRGNNELDQIHQLVRIAVRFVLVSQLTTALIIALVSNPVSDLLTTDDNIAAVLNQYLWVVPISYSALGVCMIMVSVCSALGTPNLALLISVLRLLVCYIPGLWIGSQIGGLTGLFFGAMAGNLLAGLVGWQLYQRRFNQMRARLQSESTPIADRVPLS
ncbi:MATE family efflux transporter [Motiliproteus sp.]|uniref:MATE family efflux transporter n=1 Tax=Motiliproteus sp. TaxID=1898955 RepID=UPI003BAC4718